MTRPRASGLVQSVLDRLKNAARERDRPFAELLELYAIERFLHRLGCSPHREHFVLKGAMLMRHWLGADTRPTRDVDLLAPVDLDADDLCELLGDLLRVEVEEDGIDFDMSSIVVRPIRAESTVLGFRARFDGRTLAESVRRTFARRSTRVPEEPLDGLCDRFASEPLHATRWRAFLTKNQLEAIEVDFRRVVEYIRRFAQQILDAVREDQPFDRHWPPGGPWGKTNGEE